MKPTDNDIKKLADKAAVNINTEIDNKVFNKILAAAQNETKIPAKSKPAIWRTIMKNKITKLAAAAVVAIAMIPLTYGAVTIVKSYILGSVGTDQFKGEFKLSENIRVELRIGMKEERRVVSAGNIRFFKEGEQVLGTLRCVIGSWPKFKWRTKVELLADDTVLNHTEHISENGGVKPGRDINHFQHNIHFSLGSWSDVSRAQFFRIGFEQVSQETETTPQAWVEAKELEVVHGRITGPNGEPIANAVIQIREKRKKGQKTISAPNVRTDKNGYYSYDRINWPYRVGALLYEELYENTGYRFQYKRLNRVLEGTQAVDFLFDEFPEGSAILSGSFEGSKAEVVSARLKVDWKDYLPEYLYQFGYKIPLSTTDGKFEINGLPAGKYLITKGLRYYYECMLVDGQRTEINTEDSKEKVWYGRVMFDDDTPAVLDLPGIETHIVNFTQGYAKGMTIAAVEADGYFAAYISDEDMARLKSGKSSLSINVSKTNHFPSIRKEKFP
ncbi:MAG: hypothetical protein ACYTBP_12580, partial [Planctomycetota bacterium]